MNHDLIDQIKSRLPLQSFLESQYGLEFTGKQALCPFHSRKSNTPSLTVYDDRKYYCFSCRCHGDVLTFVTEYEKIDFQAALEKLAAIAGIEIPKKTGVTKGSVERILSLAVDFYHENFLKNENKHLLKSFVAETGLSDETIRQQKIGLATEPTLLFEFLKSKEIQARNMIASSLIVRTRTGMTDYFTYRTIFPLFRNGKPWFITARRIKGETPTDLPWEQGKYKHIKTSSLLSLNQFINEDILEATPELIITEGVTDTLMAIQMGLPAIGVLGASAFKESWGKKLEGKTVYICFDADDAGREGAKRTQSFLKGSKLIRLSEEGTDLSDFFNGGGTVDVFRKLMKTALPDELPIELHHLLDIEDPKYDSKLVSVDVVVLGMNSNSFHATKKYRATCNSFSQCKIADCPLKVNEGVETFTLERDSREYINSIQSTDLMVVGSLRAKTCILGKKIKIEVIEKETMQEIFAIPKVRRFRPVEDKVTKETRLVDTENREYKEKKLFYIGYNAATSMYYRAVGYVKTHPRTQAITLLVNQLLPLNDDYQQFELDDDAKKRMKTVRDLVNDPTSFPFNESFASMKRYLNDVTLKVTKVYQRDDMLFGMLLIYHSVLSFNFNNEYVHRGYCELIVVGDSGQAKTHMFNKLADFIGVGDMVSGLSSSRTGISYSLIQDSSSGWTIKWGLLPLNTRKLLAIDEAGTIDKQDLRQMSMARSEGYLKVDRIANGEAECRTRTIFLTNPRGDKILDEWMYGCESLKELFEAPDIRRFDFALFLSASDVDRALVNRLNELKQTSEQLVTADVLRTSVFWAWTRKPEQVIIDAAVTQTILDASNKLADKFGMATNVPIANPSDLRLKIARLSVAYAALRCSTDETLENVVVTEGCVQTIVEFLDRIYSHQNCSLDKYAEVQKHLNLLTEEEYFQIKQGILEQIKNEGMKDRSSTLELLKTFMIHNRIKGIDLAEQIDVEREYLTEKIRFFRRFNLLDSDNHGYFKKPKFVKFLRRVLEDKDFEW